jgi:hypothetical protein
MSNYGYPVGNGSYQQQSMSAPGHGSTSYAASYPYPYRSVPMSQSQGAFGPALALGKIGLVVGLCGAGAANLHRLQAGTVDQRGALLDTLRGGAVAGVATAAAALVASNFRSDLLSLAATLATGTAVAYALTAESVPDTAVTAADAAADA